MTQHCPNPFVPPTITTQQHPIQLFAPPSSLTVSPRWTNNLSFSIRANDFIMPYHTRNRSQTDPIPHQRPQRQRDPVFPPPGLKLHPDDDASKVLHAIAKSLLAVNNRAMTIKDLADSALRHGLVCTGSSP
jgi:hypothetical protein